MADEYGFDVREASDALALALTGTDGWRQGASDALPPCAWRYVASGTLDVLRALVAQADRHGR
jgi:hypothetical protein